MKVLIIPDTHGQDNWVEEIKNYTYDKVVFLGDYFDNFLEEYRGEVAVENFKKIVDFVREDPNNRFICVGNHDFSYLSNDHCSGYQPEMKTAYRKVLLDNADLLNLIVEIDGVWFSHAGVSKPWFDSIISFFNLRAYKEIEGFDENFSDVEKINFIFSEFLKSVEKQHMTFTYQSWFEYNRWDVSGYGNNPTQTPLWIRPQALLRGGLANRKQVVGHTEYCRGGFIHIKNEDNDILVLADSKTHTVPGWVDTDIEIDDEFFSYEEGDLQTWLWGKSFFSELEKTFFEPESLNTGR